MHAGERSRCADVGCRAGPVLPTTGFPGGVEIRIGLPACPPATAPCVLRPAEVDD